jgi:hypothetical protein
MVKNDPCSFSSLYGVFLFSMKKGLTKHRHAHLMQNHERFSGKRRSEIHMSLSFQGRMRQARIVLLLAEKLSSFLQ